MSGRSWALGPMCAWDTETTGVDVETARIVTSAVVTIRPGLPVESVEWLLDPGVQIPTKASDIHGVTTEIAREKGVDAAGGVKAITDSLTHAAVAGIPLVIFNAPYDLTVLDRECRRYGLPTVQERVANADAELFVIDPLVLDKVVVPRRKGKGARKLGALSAFYNVPLSDEDAHTAAGDCLAAARVAYKTASTFPKIAEMSLPALQVYQAEKHFEWAEGFEQWLRREGKDETVDRSWPMRPFTGAEVPS
ncbi:exonuclease domain-containing protein [Glycomyces sp. NPDC021274]|uniref:exonuclease domain-containing protein n=1 Tax=Glycomyces sp. NPDC021274 TaxID=3155120 RepID=UPI0033DEFFD8